jgi:hypothetical protein
VLNTLRAPTLVSKWYVNRALVSLPPTPPAGGTAPLARRIVGDVLVGAPAPHDVMATAAAFVCAGTPEWVERAERWWFAALSHGVPVALCGVGRAQPLDRVHQARELGLLRGVTVRDTQAEELLRNRGGLDPRWFPCPSTAATPKSYRAESKDIPLVIVPRLQCGPNVVQHPHYWRDAAERYGSRATVIAVHEPAELALARDVFGRQDVFYSSRSSDYLELYARAEVVLAGRLHAALPTVAAGGTAYLPLLASKFEAAQRMQRELDPDGPLRVLGACDLLDELVPRDPAKFLERLDAANADHAGYWSERTCEWY